MIMPVDFLSVAFRAGPSGCGAQCKTQARGSSEQWCYYVTVLTQTCYDLFDEDILAKLLYEYKKATNYWR